MGLGLGLGLGLGSRLLLRALGVHDVYVEVVVDELVEELHRALLGLHEDEHGRREPLLDEVAQREQLAVLAPGGRR